MKSGTFRKNTRSFGASRRFQSLFVLPMLGLVQCSTSNGSLAPRDGEDAHAREDAYGGADTGRADAADARTSDVGPPQDGGHDGAILDSGRGDVTDAGAAYSCPPGATLIDPSMDAATTTTTINSAPAGATLCIAGNHPVTATLLPKANQTWIGVGADPRLGGSVTLQGWNSDGPGVWYFDGPAANIAPTIQQELSTGVCACNEVSVYADDVFFNDQRMLRVLAVAELGSGALPTGQKATPVEYGRFFFDYANHRIYVDQDPTSAQVELAVQSVLVKGGGGVDGVTIEGLTLEKATGLVISAEASANWTIRDVTARFAHDTGIAVPHGTSGASKTLLQRVVATNNGRYGMSGSGNWIALDACEISWNNLADYHALKTLSCPVDGGAIGGACGGFWGAGGAKFVLALGTSMADPGLDVENLNAHDNVGPGFWLDVHNQYVRLAGGEYHDNEGDGVFYEISCDGEITGATFYGNGRPIKAENASTTAAGVHVSDSNGCVVHDNVVFGNPTAIDLEHPGHKNMLARLPENQCPPATTDTDISSALRNNVVRNNTVYLCAGQTTGSSTAGVTLSSRSNVFEGNAYDVASLSGSYWENGGLEDWTAWQASGQDGDGGLTHGCAAPPH
jgi:hypothetical protein